MSRRRTWAILFLLLQFGLLTAGMPRTALTYDEPSHLASGYAALARGQDGLWTMQHRGHPVLVDVWAALPLFVGAPDVAVESMPGWQHDYKAYVRAFIEAVGPLSMVEIAGRVPTALITLILSATVYAWAQRLTEGRSGWLALAVLAFDPNLLGHGRLATNDVGVTALGTLGLFMCWRWRERETEPLPATLGRAAAAGAVLGLACLAKASGVIWLPVALFYALLAGGKGGMPNQRRAFRVMVLAVTAGLTLWAGYGFSWGSIPELGGLAVPAPLHWETLFFQTASADQRLAYALGHLKMGGWWWYFPLAFALKTPLPLLLVLSLSLASVLTQRALRRRAALPLAFAAVYVVVAIMRGPNIGYRHLLPLHPTLALSIATGWSIHRRERRKQPNVPVALLPPSWWRHVRAHNTAALAILGLWYVVGTLTSFPNEIAYFNAVIGNREDKHRYLISSNLDWGQMTKQLATYLKTHSAADTYVAYSHIAPYPLPSDGYLPPHPDEISDYAPFHPAPGLYAIGTTSLHIPTACCGMGLDGYAYFRNADPVASLGDAILVYETTEEDIPRWLVQCGTDRLPLGQEAIATGFPDNGIRRQIALDCTQAWIYPDAGATPGVYALAKTAEEPALTPDAFLESRLVSARLTYHQRAGFILAPFSLYELNGIIPVPTRSLAGPADVEVPPREVTAHREAHYVLKDEIEFLGVTALASSRAVDVVDIATWWRMIEVPDRQFSIMAHLLHADGGLVEVGDGISLNQAFLKPNDIIVQRHTFSVDGDSAGDDLWLRTGIYWLDTLERWPVDQCPGCDAIFARIE